MTPWKIVKKLVKVLRGGASQRDIALGVLLGFTWGMVPGFNVTVLAIILLLVILNANIVTAFLALVLGKILALLLAPVMYNFGFFLIHTAGLEGLVRAMGNAPVLAFMDFQIYCVLSGLIVGLIGGAILAVLAAWGVKNLRKGLMKMNENQAVQKISGNIVSRIAIRILFGKTKASIEEGLNKKSPLFRPKGLVLIGVVIVICGAVTWLSTSHFFAMAVEKGLSTANGAEVNVSSASMNLLTGNLTIKGLQVTNPKKPEQNSFQADSIVLDVSMSALLAKRVSVELISCKKLMMDTPREKPGEVYPADQAEDAAPQPEPWSMDIGVPSAEYIEKGKKLAEYVKKLNEYLKDEGEKPKPTPAELKEEQTTDASFREYQSLSAEEVLRKHPAWLIQQLEFEVYFNNEFPPVEVKGENLSSDRKLAPAEPEPSLKVTTDLKKVATEYFTQNGGKGILDSIKDIGGDSTKDVDKDDGEKKNVLDKLNPFK